MARDTATIGVVQNHPPLPPGVANVALSAATARSQVATSWQPAAVAMPCTCATTGCGTRWIVRMKSSQTANSLRIASRPRSAMSAKSWPEENTGPAAASTIARTSSRSASEQSAAVSSSRCASESALRRSGRFMVITPRSASRETKMSR